MTTTELRAAADQAYADWKAGKIPFVKYTAAVWAWKLAKMRDKGVAQ